MLRTLRIRDLLIVEDLTVEFEPGFNVLTGETGAGKSILLDALGLATGRRADRTLVRRGADRAIVEALFDASDSPDVLRAGEEAGLEADDGQFLVRREVAAGGAHRAVVNGSPVTLGPLRRLGERLLAIHAQHEAATLARADRQLALVDGFGVPRTRLDAVAQAAAAAQDLLDERARIVAAGAERERTIEGLKRTIAEIDEVAPAPGELDRLDGERALLRSAEEVGGWLETISATCHDGEPSAAGLATTAARAAGRLADLDPTFDELRQRLDSAAVELQEAALTARQRRDDARPDPDRLERIEGRRVELERLLLRYGEDEAAVLAVRDEAAERLEQLEDPAGALQRIEARLAEAAAEYAGVADVLAESRREAAGRLERRVAAQLKVLALPRARLQVAWEPADGTELPGADGRMRPLNRRGTERPRIDLAANPGEPFSPLARAASGGERSRILLALLVAAGDDVESVRVFDEIDSGVGGSVADAVGARLRRLAGRGQALSVTHAPQVAAHADHHLAVSKQVRGGRTTVSVQPLDRSGRVEELARMLAGKAPTETSRRHADDLLRAAAVEKDPGGDTPSAGVGAGKRRSGKTSSKRRRPPSGRPTRRGAPEGALEEGA